MLSDASSRMLLLVLVACLSHSSWLHSEDGRALLLRGLNVVNKQAPHDYQAMGIGSRHAQFISSHGFNAVRLGTMWEAIEPEKGQYNRTHVAQLRGTVQTMCNEGIHVLLDLHQDAFTAAHGGYGFPKWAAMGKGKADKIGFPLNYFGSNETGVSMVVAEDFDFFWNRSDIRQSYASLLQLIASELGTIPCILGIALINEPFPGSSWENCGVSDPSIPFFKYNFTEGCKQFDRDVYTPWIQDAINAIRAKNKQIRIFFSPNGLAGLGAASHIGPLRDPSNKLVYSYHDYSDYARVIADSSREQAERGVPAVMTEFGANKNVSHWMPVLELADQNLANWMYWAYVNNPTYKFANLSGNLPKDPRVQGLVLDPKLPPEGENVDMVRVKALSRPFPVRTAGIPTKIDFDSETKSFRCEWSTASATKDVAQMYTEVFLPELHYAKGKYTVSVEGGFAVKCVQGDTPIPAFSQLVCVQGQPGSKVVKLAVDLKY